MTTLLRLVGAVAAAALWIPDAATAEIEITLGVVGPRTGESAYGGDAQLEGIALAIEEYNRSPRGPFTLDYVSEDDKGDPEAAVEAIKRLLALDPPPLAILGSCNSSCTFKMAPIALQHEVLLLTGVSAATAVTSIENPFVFRTAVTSRQQMEDLAAYLDGTRSYDSYVIVYERDDSAGNEDVYGGGMKGDFLDALTSRGVPSEKVIQIAYQRNHARSTKDRLAELRGKGRLAIGMFGLVDDAIIVCKLVRQLDLRNATVFGGTGIAASRFVEAGGVDVTGTVVLAPFYAFDSELAVYDFTRRYHERYHEYPDTYAAQAYDATRMLIEALLACDLSRYPTDIAACRLQVRDQLQAVGKRGYNGLTGFIVFDPKHDSDKNRTLHVLRAQPGQFVPIRTSAESVGFLGTLISMPAAVAMCIAAVVGGIVGLLVARRGRVAADSVGPRPWVIGIWLALIMGAVAGVYWAIPDFPEPVAFVFSLVLLVLALGGSPRGMIQWLLHRIGKELETNSSPDATPRPTAQVIAGESVAGTAVSGLDQPIMDRGAGIDDDRPM